MQIVAVLLAVYVALPSQAASVTLRTAAQDNNPLKYDAADSKKPGVCVEVIQRIEKLEPQLKFSGLDKQVSLPRIEIGLADGQFDVFCGLIKNSSRAAKFAFIDVPVYTVRHKIAVRADDTVDVKNFEEIRKLGLDGIIIVMKATAYAEELKERGGLEIDAASRDTETNFRKLLFKRGRFFYHTEKDLLRYITSNHLEDKIKLLPSVFKEEGMLFAVSKSLPPATVAQLHKALKTLSDSGELKTIYASYKDR